MTCQPNSRDSSTDRRKSFKVFMPQDSRRSAGITTFSKLSEIKGYEVFRADRIGFELPDLDVGHPAPSVVSTPPEIAEHVAPFVASDDALPSQLFEQEA